ncbi:D-beta-hydroxybutyrate dehydrogenase, mitochondrial-like [Ptychodera flava]|uniref:D-beta-hydroxybutyrate dehydrogenase, mitochondrial-like n=1 Tax=Ptychodera flava TaxID=63121 RepID=UPI00396A603D
MFKSFIFEAHTTFTYAWYFTRDSSFIPIYFVVCWIVSGLWALVNNAGRSTFGHVEWCTMETYQDMADVTLWGVVRTTKAFLPLIRKAKGRVVNVTSILGLINSPSRSAYTICKHGVESFSDCLRYEMKPWGVTVCVVEPANFIVATGIYTPESVRKIGDKLWNEATDEIRKDYGKDSFEAQVGIMSKYCIEGYRGMDLVVDAIEAAVMSEKPQQRYFVCDWKVKLKTMARIHLPSCIGENM